MRGGANKSRFEPAAALLCLTTLFSAFSLVPRTTEAQNENTWSVSIVLPPRLVASEPATLATLGLDGKLVPHITVDLSTGEKVETDATGRAVFTVPKTGAVLIARAAGSSSAALIDGTDPNNEKSSLALAPILSLRDSFSICGGGFQGEAEKNRVQINSDYALVVASSSECLGVVASPKTAPGAATVTVRTQTGPENLATTFVSFAFDPPQPALTTGAKSWLTLRASGSDRRLNALVTNETPGVIQFDKGDSQQVTTSGGSQNTAQIRIEALRSGDFSFRARLLAAPNVELARAFLAAAQPIAPGDLRRNLKKIAGDLERHPKNVPKLRVQLQQIVSTTMTGDLRTILEAAYAAL